MSFPLYRTVVGAALLMLAMRAQSAAAQTLVVHRAPGDSLMLRRADIDALKAEEIATSDHGTPARFRGVRLLDVLARAGVKADSLRGAAALTLAIVVHAKDGYRAAFTLAELATDLGNQPAFLVWQRDGAPLKETAAPWQVVTPGDARAARWVRMVQAIVVTTVR